MPRGIPCVRTKPLRDIWPIRLGADTGAETDADAEADAVPGPNTERETRLDKRHTETTRGDVGGQHDGRAAGLEFGEHPVALGLLPEKSALLAERTGRSELTCHRG